MSTVPNDAQGEINGSTFTAADVVQSVPEPDSTTPASRTERGGSIQVYEFDDRQALAVSAPPVEREDVTGPVLKAVATMQASVKDALAIRKDPLLSEQGKLAALGKPVQRAAAEVARAWESADTLSLQLGAKRLGLYDVPSLQPGDAVGALTDRELREWFCGLSPDERQGVTAKLVGGHLTRLAVALKRSPIPLGSDERVVEDAWRAAIDAEHAEEIAEIEKGRAAAAWAKQIAERMAKAIVSEHGALQANQYALADALKPLDLPDGVGPFKGVFRPQSVQVKA